jgi:hypothetical protein
MVARLRPRVGAQPPLARPRMNPPVRLELAAQPPGCYSCLGQIEEGLYRLGSPQCQDCRDERLPLNPEHFLALGPAVVDGIDMAAILRRRRNLGAEAGLDGMKRAA